MKRQGALIERLSWATGLTTFADGYNLTVVPACLPILLRQFHLSGLAGTELAAGTLFGSLIGGMVGGWLVDRWGRQLIFRYDLWLFAALALLSALAPSFVLLLATRILLGVAIGADYVISPTYLAEFAPSRQRGRDLSFVWLMWPLGAALSDFIAALLLPAAPPATGWRVLLALAAIPALMGLILRRGIPESPRWLLGVAGDHQSGHALIRRYDLEPVELQPARKLPASAFARWMTAVGPWICLTMASYGIGMILPTVLSRSGLVDLKTADWITGVVTVGGVPGALIAMVWLDRLGRRSLQIAGFLAASFLLWGLAEALNLHISAFLATLILLTAAQIVSNAGPGTISGIYPAELFPTHRRGTATGISTALSRLGAVAATFLFAAVSKGHGLTGVAGIAGGIMLVGGLLTWLFGPETTGRTLEELS